MQSRFIHPFCPGHNRSIYPTQRWSQNRYAAGMTGNSFNWCCNRRLGIQDYREAITHDHKMLSFMLLRRRNDAVFLFIMINAGLLTCLVCVCAAEMSLPWRMSGLSLREKRVRISVSQKWFGAELIFLHIKWSQLKWLRQLTKCFLDTSEVKCFRYLTGRTLWSRPKTNCGDYV